MISPFRFYMLCQNITGETDKKVTEINRTNRTEALSEKPAVSDFYYSLCGRNRADFAYEDEYPEKLSGTVTDSEGKYAAESV